MAGVSLNKTVDSPWVEPNQLPFMVTVAPTDPDLGESEVMKGGFIPVRVVINDWRRGVLAG